MSSRKRKDYTKEPINNIKYPVYFVENFNGYNPITVVETKVVDIDGIKKDYYYANNIGELYNKSGKLVKPRLINSGYHDYCLSSGQKNPKYKHITAHRLFKTVFDPIENSESMTVNHINRNRFKNELSNLEWKTQKENNDEKYRNCNYGGSNNYKATFNMEQLIVIVNELNKGTSYSDILKILGMEVTDNNKDYIGNIKRGITYKEEVNMILNNRSSTTRA